VFGVGGYEVIAAAALGAGMLAALLALVLRRVPGWPTVTAWAVAGLLWSLAVIALVTLIPTSSDVGVVRADLRPEGCSFDLGGPAPDGFWIFSGTQRLLNTVAFLPAGALLVVAASRWRAAWVLVPAGLLGLAAYSVGIEWVQLELARIDRRCDVTDVVDNVTGAVVGAVIGLVLAMILRPWRGRT